MKSILKILFSKSKEDKVYQGSCTNRNYATHNPKWYGLAAYVEITNGNL